MAAVYVDPPTGQDVGAFLGRGDDTQLVALAGEHIPIVTAMVRSYTRGNGFNGQELAQDLAAVVTTATARLTANPELVKTESIGDYSVTPGAFLGWTLAETFVLNRYRKRAL